MPWTTCRAEGTVLPEGRGGHAVAVLDTATQQHLYVFGGADRSPCAFGDLWRLTLSGAALRSLPGTLGWTVRVSGVAAPPADCPSIAPAAGGSWKR
jgi:hypothetical protein